jgi:uncharacterized protein (DUF2267 family)
MVTTAIFDTSLQQAHAWLRVIGGKLGTSNERSACAALRAALHVVRDSLTMAEALEFGDRLPVLVRGLYYEGWHLKNGLETKLTPDEAMANARHDVRGHDELLSQEETLRAGFDALRDLLPEDEVQNLVQALPATIQRLWR